MNITEGDDAAAALDQLLGAGDDLTPDPFEALEANDPAETSETEATESDDEGEGEAQRPNNGPPKHVPYKRLQQVVHQRNELQAKLAKLETTESELRTQLSGAESFRNTFHERYGKFRNPVAQLALDADFMSAMEDLSKTDPEVSNFYKKVMNSMGQQPQQQQSAQQPEPVKDARMDVVVEKLANATIKDVLDPLGLQDRHQRLVTNYVLQHAGDLAALDAAGVRTLARRFIADSGFTLEEMRRAKDSPVQPAKPKTAGAGGGAAPAAPKAKKAAEPKKFANREEYLRHRAALVDSMIDEVLSSASSE